MSKIFRGVSLQDTPHVIAPVLPRFPEPEETEEQPPDAAGQDEEGFVVEEAVRQGGEEISEAMGLVAAAREKAAAMVAAAGEEAESVRREAHDEGYRHGYDEGLARGEAAAMEQARGALANAAAQAERIISEAQRQAGEAFAAAERQVVELALAVAGKVLAREVAEDPAVILPIVKAALAKVEDQERITIRVHPGCYELVLAARPDLQASLTRANTVTVTADGALKEGDCIVETPFGTVDARIDTQLELVKAALKELMP